VRGIVPDALLIVIDDGSRDTTGRVATEHDVQVIAHPRNAGKGAALRTGIRAALTHGAGVLVTIDADGQHPPEEIPRLIESITRDQADLVLGARARGSAMPLRRRFTNWISARLASRIGRQAVRDAQTGFRAFTREVAERIQPAGERYEYEANFLLDALRANFRVSSIDVPTIYGPASHFRPWADTWRMARTFARHAGRIIAGAT
jgi:glycosyltransferase involved in cell wall biosynthesis